MTYWENSEDEEDGRSSNRMRASVLAHLDLDIHRELTWILCSRVLAQLRSVVIPLSDMARYLDAAPQTS